MLASIVVDNLLQLHRYDEQIGICYIFLDLRFGAEQKLENLVANLLRQLSIVHLPYPNLWNYSMKSMRRGELDHPLKNSATRSIL